MSYLNSLQMGLPQEITCWQPQMLTAGEAEPELSRLAKNSKAGQTIASKTVLDSLYQSCLAVTPYSAAADTCCHQR